MSKKQTIIHLVRHAEVENPHDILYGRLPRYGLSERGRKQAEVTASVLAEEPVAAIYTSPQLRARQTARILAGPHPDVPIHTSKLLAEVLTGWQGRPHSDLDGINFDFYGNPLGEQDEKIADVWARMERFVRRALRKHIGQSVIAVTHGDPVLIARTAYLGQPLRIESLRRPDLPVYPGLGSIMRLTFEGKDTYPSSVEYYDPNSPDPAWSHGWVRLDASEDAA